MAGARSTLVESDHKAADGIGGHFVGSRLFSERETTKQFCRKKYKESKKECIIASAGENSFWIPFAFLAFFAAKKYFPSSLESVV
jgi:hypothetical protein